MLRIKGGGEGGRYVEVEDEAGRPKLYQLYGRGDITATAQR